MGIVSKLSSAVIFGYCGWIIIRLSILLFNLYYPSFSVKSLFYAEEGLHKHHIAWDPSIQYYVSLYVSENSHLDSSFFDSADLAYRSPLLVVKSRSGVYFAPSKDHRDRHSPQKGFISEKVTLSLPEKFWALNKTIYAHTFIHNKNSLVYSESLSTYIVNFEDPFLLGTSSQLISWKPRIIDNKLSLLDKSESINLVNKQLLYKDLLEPHAKTRLVIDTVFDDFSFNEYRFPADIAPYIRLIHKKAPSKDSVPDYLPIVLENQLGIRSEHFIPLTNYSISSNGTIYRLESETLSSFPLEFIFSVSKLGWVRLALFLNKSFSSMQSGNSLYSTSSQEIDNLKEMIYESDYKLVFLTIIASIFHILFEFLAYKEDISFFSKSKGQNISKDTKKSSNDNQRELSSHQNSLSAKKEKAPPKDSGLVGGTQIAETNSQYEFVSRSGLIMKAFSSTIGMLYLFDHKESTSILIIIGSLFGAILDIWKVSRVFDFSRFKISNLSNLFSSGANLLKSSSNITVNNQNSVNFKSESAPKRELKSNDDKNNTEDNTLSENTVRDQVDKQTMWVLLNFGAPILLAYGGYSLAYEKHSSYFSFAIHMALTTVYVLEFVQMLPQILINYKLKSVESIPITAFMYRFFTTFIDDLFAMVIPMPTLTRLGTFRDDIVFFVLCYQWWVYPSKKKEKEPDSKSSK
ncbi:hypothetical protein BB560_004394 [Smittium megazygosporum]|uniref:Cleft lip and palate transmembrane 1 n=1 Tax=Smittium megazygosporum TaxID=133381 RepID=A0A2T9Z9C4_9FUNG|nr:hypothetical protein BB560_004394 [Smittium megazygosporum]